jgi:hypothetical protein
MFEAMLLDPGSQQAGIGGYPETVISAAVPGILIAFLSFYCGSCCCCQRCCCQKRSCCRSCRFTPSTTRVYSFMFQMYPLTFYAVAAFLIFIFAIVGIDSGSGKFVNAFIRGSCTIDTGEFFLSIYRAYCFLPPHPPPPQYSYRFTTKQ